MSKPVEIALHADRPPGFGQVVGWVIGANVFVMSTVAIVFVLLPWLAGHQPKLDTETLVIAGATGIALMVGFLFVSIVRHRQKSIGTPAAHLVLDESTAVLRPKGGKERSCSREELVLRPVHAHESLRGVDYYLGPALELRIGDESWVIATMDGKRRWSHDPPAVAKVDWVVGSEAWIRLLRAEELDDGLVSYQP